VIDLCLVHESWFSTEAEHWVLLVVVVRFEDTTNHVNCSFVLVARSHKMKGIFFGGWPVGRSVVDSNAQADLPSTSQVVDKGGVFWDDRLRILLGLRLFVLLGSDCSHDHASVFLVLHFHLKNLRLSGHNLAHGCLDEAH